VSQNSVFRERESTSEGVIGNKRERERESERERNSDRVVSERERVDEKRERGARQRQWESQ